MERRSFVAESFIIGAKGPKVLYKHTNKYNHNMKLVHLWD